MSKRLPYYQSEPAEYLAGDIMFCSYGAQGVFSIVRALYWQKDCNLTLNQLKRRLKDAEDYIEELINEGIIKVESDNISITFLDEQFNKASGVSKANSENGKKGAAKRWANKEVVSEIIAPPLKKDSESIALREDKIREDKIREDNTKKEAFDFFWNLYDKKIGDKEKVFKKWCKLSNEEKQLINDYIPKYKISQPEKRYRKNPETFLNNKGWNDEIIIENNSKSTFVAPVITDSRLM